MVGRLTLVSREEHVVVGVELHPYEVAERVILLLHADDDLIHLALIQRDLLLFHFVLKHDSFFSLFLL